MDKYWLERISPQIHVIAHGSANQSWVEPPRRLYDHQLAVFTEGKCLVQIGKKTFPCEAGSFIIIPPDTLHAAKAADKGFYNYSIHFDWIFSAQSLPKGHCVYHPRRIPESAVHHPPTFVPKMPLIGKIEFMEPAIELLNKLTFCWTSSRAAQKASCRGLFLELLLLILTPVFNPSPKEDRYEHLANEVRKLLQQPISQKQSIQEVLQTLGHSYAHLCRIFRKIYGATPIEYPTRHSRNQKGFRLCRVIIF